MNIHKISFFHFYFPNPSKFYQRTNSTFIRFSFPLPPPLHIKNASRLSRRLADEDDELSEVQPDAVPPEVREWLASTFTRQLATTKKRSDEKPKFRSVAHAIRAGIFVDRIYRRVSSSTLMQFPPEVVTVLKVTFLDLTRFFIS